MDRGNKYSKGLTPNDEKRTIDQLIDESRLDELIQELKNESDRAAVILITSYIDDQLGILLSYLFVEDSQHDKDFYGSNGISTFGLKIDLCYRLGIVSKVLWRDLKIIKSIRNSFAHDLANCNFSNSDIASRIRELSRFIAIIPRQGFLKPGESRDTMNNRDIFTGYTTLILFELELKAYSVKNIMAKEKEWIYSPLKKE
jgi:DNA-binding MltR family transcriptional regulator